MCVWFSARLLPPPDTLKLTRSFGNFICQTETEVSNQPGGRMAEQCWPKALLKEGRKEKKTDEEQSRRERRERTRSEGEKERLWRNGEMVNLIEKESNGNNSLLFSYRVVGFLLRLRLGIESGKIFILKSPGVSSLKDEAECRLFLAWLRKCWDPSEACEILNFHSECSGHSEFTADEIGTTEESW